MVIGPKKMFASFGLLDSRNKKKTISFGQVERQGRKKKSAILLLYFQKVSLETTQFSNDSCRTGEMNWKAEFGLSDHMIGRKVKGP